MKAKSISISASYISILTHSLKLNSVLNVNESCFKRAEQRVSLKTNPKAEWTSVEFDLVSRNSQRERHSSKSFSMHDFFSCD